MKLPLGVGKYQVCAVAGCGRNAITEFYAVHSTGSMTCLGACEEHLTEVRGQAARVAIMANVEGFNTTLDLSKVMTSAANDLTGKDTELSDKKSRKKLKEADDVSIPRMRELPKKTDKDGNEETFVGAENSPSCTTTEATTRKKRHEEPAALPKRFPVKSWEPDFEENFWTDLNGDRFEIEKLPDEELCASALQLAQANYQRMRDDVVWVRDLLQTIDVHYPSAPLAVGKRVAFAKLQEFRKECVRRGMLAAAE